MSENAIVGLGARSDFVAPRPNVSPTSLKLNGEETAVFATIGRAARIDEIIKGCGLPEAKAIAVLLSLRAKGAIVPARVNRSTGPSAPLDAAMSEQVEMEDERKKEVLDLERDLERKNHFEVLGLAAGASPEDVKKAFYELSRKFHPDRYYNKNLGSFRSRIEGLFKRISEAHRTLTDEGKRAEYLKEHPALARAAPAASSRSSGAAEAPRPRTPEDDAREAERKARFGRHPYFAKAKKIGDLVGRSKTHVAKGDFGKALADLNIAAQADPKNAEIQSLLLEARKGHEAARATEEMRKAKEAEDAMDLTSAAAGYKMAATIDPNNADAAFMAAKWMHRTGQDIKEIKIFAQRAVELKPKNAEAHLILGEALMELGVKKLAVRHLEQVLELDPDNAEAKKHLKKARWSF